MHLPQGPGVPNCMHSPVALGMAAAEAKVEPGGTADAVPPAVSRISSPDRGNVRGR